jgi:hypothetical protein
MLSLALACMHAGIRQRFGGDASDGATCRKEGGREGVRSSRYLKLSTVAGRYVSWQ